MQKNECDLIIIGGGPAGLTAGLYATRAGLDTIMLEKMAPGGQVMVTDWVENYPGFIDGISGADLVQNMTAQAQRFGLKVQAQEVRSLDFSDSLKKINLEGGKTIKAPAVIIASGASPRKLGIPGEDRFYGRGISTCATCDGPFFRGKIVAAVGGGDTAVQESIFLTKFAEKVYLIHRRDQLRAAAVLQERVLANDKIEILWDSVVTGVDGLSNIEKIKFKNVKTNQEQDLKVDGFFVWIGILPNQDFINGAIAQDQFGFIKTDDNMQTSVKGVFAAGDIRTKLLRQISTAVGDGATAAVAAEHYIEGL